MKTAGYEITNKEGDTVFVMLPDAGRAALAAAQNHGQFYELVRRVQADAVADALVAAIVAAHKSEAEARAVNTSGASP